MSQAGRWSLLPVVVLRHAGFNFDTVEVLADPAAATEAACLAGHADRMRPLAQQVKEALRREEPPRRAAVSSAVGMLLPVPRSAFTAALSQLSPGAGALLHSYQRESLAMAAQWPQWQVTHRSRLVRTGEALIETFRKDRRLRDVLLLSNDAQYPLFDAWLEEGVDPGSDRGRKLVDVLCRYLQRVATKNETHSHFGPVAVGWVDTDATRVAWRWGHERRTVHFSHWSASRLARSLSATAVLAGWVRPRRRPWALLEGSTITRYAFTSEEGLAADWRFHCAAQAPVSEAEAWLFSQCDGSRTVATLRVAYHERYGRTRTDFDSALASLTSQDFVVAQFEVPVGVPDPLRHLRLALDDAPADHVTVDSPAADSPEIRQVRERIARLETLLDQVARSELPDRPAAVAALKQEFTELTGARDNRGAGHHYADRAIFFEECRSPVQGLRISSQLATFLERDLAPIYQLALAGPRLRLIRETVLLADWAARRFGVVQDVPLNRFYAAYFDDRDALLEQCDNIDAEIDRWDAELTTVLLDEADPVADEVIISQEQLRELTARCPDHPAAVCNPDVMLAAADVEALRRGDFLAVVGDLHAVRELLTHSSLSVVLQQQVPDLAERVAAGYQQLLEPDELLCDMARSHPDKTATQALLPIPDVEIYGRSPKPRGQVITPDRMYVRTAVGGIELRAAGIDQRLRLMAPPAGGPSIRQDPLSPFAFPRRLGGLNINARDHVRVPRIRCGRVVLQRQLWRLPVAELRGVDPSGRPCGGDAAEYLAASRARIRWGLPRYAFAKLGHEPKPLFVDFESPLLVRQLCRMARAAAGPVEFSEMLPGPDSLWLERCGARHTCEIRCAVFASTGAYSSETSACRGVSPQGSQSEGGSPG